MSDTTAPAEFLTITQDGKEREIFMTFGLLNEVTRLIGDPANAVAVYYNPAVREVLILTLLHERDKCGKVVTEYAAIDDVEISISQTEELLAWGWTTRSLFSNDRCSGWWRRSRSSKSSAP